MSSHHHQRNRYLRVYESLKINRGRGAGKKESEAVFKQAGEMYNAIGQVLKDFVKLVKPICPTNEVGVQTEEQKSPSHQPIVEVLEPEQFIVDIEEMINEGDDQSQEKEERQRRQKIKERNEGKQIKEKQERQQKKVKKQKQKEREREIEREIERESERERRDSKRENKRDKRGSPMEDEEKRRERRERQKREEEQRQKEQAQKDVESIQNLYQFMNNKANNKLNALRRQHPTIINGEDQIEEIDASEDQNSSLTFRRPTSPRLIAEIQIPNPKNRPAGSLLEVFEVNPRLENPKPNTDKDPEKDKNSHAPLHVINLDEDSN